MASDDSTVRSELVEGDLGYRRFRLGGFEFRRDRYFAHVKWPKGSHSLDVTAFAKALMRDVAWGFFYGWVNFDDVFGTTNHYGTVDVYAGRYNAGFRAAGTDYFETFPTSQAGATFNAMLEDWTNEGFDPFAAPQETGNAYGPKTSSNLAAVRRARVVCKRAVGLAGDIPRRTDENGYPVNRDFADVPQDEPEVRPEPGFEGQIHAFNLYSYLSRSDVTWNPSVCSVVKDSLFCPTSEEHILPIFHGNDRVEWFVQLSDTIEWEVADKETGSPRARVIMHAGDVAAMPADIKHKGFSPKRSMLLVWENADSKLPALYAAGKLSPYPVDF